MKKILSLLLLILCVPCFFVGCDKLTVEKNAVETCSALSTKLVQTYYNKPENSKLDDPTDENFYVQVEEDETRDLTSISINNVIYKKDTNYKFSVGNNNFVTTPIWKLENGKLFIALPTLYVEAKGGITKIEASDKIINVKVYENSGNLSMGNVGAFGKTEGAKAEKTVDSSGKIIVKHTRESGRTFVGWVLTKENKPISKDLYVFTRKYYEESKSISYGIDVTADSEEFGYSTGLYNYYANGDITEPKSRKIDYVIAIPRIGNIEFVVDITENVPGNA